MQHSGQRGLEAYDHLKPDVNSKKRPAKTVPKQINEGSGEVRLLGAPSILYAGSLHLKHQSVAQLHQRAEDAAHKALGELQPVFRTSPFTTKTLRGPIGTSTRVLFVDEGNCCRSILAEAMFKKVLDRLKESGTCLDVQCESASLGPAFVDHDERVARLAREAGLTLQPRHTKCFDEIQDMVHFDLVLVMDKFDLEEVLREVAVLDTINPGGFYAAKVRQFGNFAAASTHFSAKRAPWALLAEGIQDPLYGNLRGQEEEARLWGTLRKLRLSCAGLAQFLVELQARNQGSASLKQSLFHALLCPLLGALPLSMQNSAWQPPVKEKTWRPVWQAAPADDHKYTLRKLDGKKFVVRKADPPYKVKRKYWTNLQNVKEEIQLWAQMNGMDPAIMPTNNQLRGSGANQLCNAIEYHDGYHAVAQKLGLTPANRHTNGYWTEATLCQEILEFASARSDSSSASEPTMPTVQEMLHAGRPDLKYAVSKHGGAKHIARIVGLPLKKSRQKCRAEDSRATASVTQLNDLHTILKASCTTDLRRGILPSRASLRARGFEDLVMDIQAAGGFRAVAKQLHLQYMPTRKGQ